MSQVPSAVFSQTEVSRAGSGVSPPMPGAVRSAASTTFDPATMIPAAQGDTTPEIIKSPADTVKSDLQSIGKFKQAVAKAVKNHKALRELVVKGAGYARDCGLALIDAQERFQYVRAEYGYATWTDYADSETGIPKSTRAHYAAIARNWEKLVTSDEDIEALTQVQARRIISGLNAEKKATEPVREQVEHPDTDPEPQPEPIEQPDPDPVVIEIDPPKPIITEAKGPSRFENVPQMFEYFEDQISNAYDFVNTLTGNHKARLTEMHKIVEPLNNLLARLVESSGGVS
jgi:hypothetical protein